MVKHPLRRGNVKDKVLVHVTNSNDRDEVIGHAVNLKDVSFPAGVRLVIPGHLQADFRVLIQYGILVETSKDRHASRNKI